MTFTNKDVKNIILPLIIEQTFAVTIGMADSVMVSSSGEAAISGVSLVDSLNLLLIYLFSALTSGGAVVISQTLGKGDKNLARSAAKQLVWVVLGISTFICVSALIFRKPLLSLIFGKIEKTVMDNALIYFVFTAMSYPFLALYNCGAAIFRTMGNSRVSMYVSFFTNVTNVCGNALLIFGFGLGAAGAAISTLVSRIAGAAIMSMLLRNKNNDIYLEDMFHCSFSGAIVKRICAIGIPNGLENGMFQFGKVMTQSLISGLGTAQIAANAVANNLAAFQYTPGSAAGIAMVTIVGHCVGAGEKKDAKKYAGKLIMIAYIIIVVTSVIFCTFINPIIGFYDLGEDSGKIAKELVFAHSLMASLIHPFAFAVTSSFRAASDVKYPMIISITSMWMFRVGFSYLFVLYFDMGVMGVWCAMFCDWIFRGSLYITRFIRGTWLTKYKPLETK